MAEKNGLLIFILTVGVFGIINTEMGVLGILPLLAEKFSVSIAQAGLLVSLFALAVAIAGPVMPLLFSGIDRKKVMLLVLGIFVLGNITAVFTDNFTLMLLARVVPAIFHPVYCSLAFSVAAASASTEAAPKAVAKVIVGVSAGMVLGVPVSSFIASNFSLTAAMSGFALVNAVALIATWFFIPSLPVTVRLSYGQQLQVLKKPDLWFSIAAVVFMNGAVFGVFGYFSGYLTSITGFSWNAVSLILLVYGLMNIAGNFLAGRLLSSGTVAERLVVIFPAALGIVYAAFFWGGSLALPMAVITLLWGVLGGMNANINQYWISTAAPEVADFANGLFLTAANLGTALGSVVCGMVIARIGMQYVMWGGVAFLVLCWAMIIARVYRNDGYFYQRRNGYFL